MNNKNILLNVAIILSIWSSMGGGGPGKGDGINRRDIAYNLVDVSMAKRIRTCSYSHVPIHTKKMLNIHY